MFVSKFYCTRFVSKTHLIPPVHVVKVEGAMNRDGPHWTLGAWRCGKPQRNPRFQSLSTLMDCLCVCVCPTKLGLTGQNGDMYQLSYTVYSIHVSMMRHHSESCLILKEKEVSTVMIPEVEELVAKYVPLIPVLPGSTQFANHLRSCLLVHWVYKLILYILCCLMLFNVV